MGDVEAASGPADPGGARCHTPLRRAFGEVEASIGRSRCQRL